MNFYRFYINYAAITLPGQIVCGLEISKQENKEFALRNMQLTLCYWLREKGCCRIYTFLTKLNNLFVTRLSKPHFTEWKKWRITGLRHTHTFIYIYIYIHIYTHTHTYSKTCLKRNAIVPVFFFSFFTGFRFTEGCVLIKQSTKNMIAQDYNEGII